MAVGFEAQRKATLESQSLYNLALGKMARNKFNDALDHLLEALRIAPDNPTYLSYFGFCLAQANGEYDRALKHCWQAVDAAPVDAVVYVNLGKVYRLSGDNKKAYETFQHAWELNKKNPSVAAELTRMGIRRPPFFTFLPRDNWCNRHLGRLRAVLERKLIGRRQS